ncbi:magnesium and cobalt transport protein CorA [Sphingomonas glacialis]|uniref:Magnesium and cobalt transport protein CorA n=1 Tax=Sphingomonas glacialis TaxID=658225 RepID=A0A502FRJ9_9SPHN|nr:magnesium and cobalt transport protein CorA [Sphingomonas glacialis]TPG52029.1 magnesium and cobalt transport protein CorA [Sphingomonas glacialis]
MTVVASCLYQNGVRIRDIAIDERIDRADDRSEFVWIGLCDPCAEEIAMLSDLYGLHPLAVEDALRDGQLPKVDVYGDQLFVIARTAHLDDFVIDYGQTAVFVGHSHIITVRQGSDRSHRPLRDQLEAAPSLLGQGVDYVLHAILDFVVDGYLPIVRAIEDEVMAMETRILDTFLDRQQIARIFALRRELIRFQRILVPMEEAARKLARTDLPCIDPEARPYFSDVFDHARRVETMVDGLREVLTSVFEFGNLIEQQRTGAITRQLAAWAAILAVPTAIAGVYGMNFEFMPELRWHYGYFVILGAIFVICGLLYVRFRKLRWL